MKFLVLPTALLPLLALAACATPESRVQTALMDAGISRPVAGCMAERMVDRLSIDQLRQIKSLSKLGGRSVEAMSIAELLHRVRALGDPEILAVVSRAGLGCAIAG